MSGRGKGPHIRPAKLRRIDNSHSTLDDDLSSSLSDEPNSRASGSRSATESRQTTTGRADDSQPNQGNVSPSSLQPSNQDTQQGEPSPTVPRAAVSNVQELNTGITGGNSTNCFNIGKVNVEPGATANMKIDIHQKPSPTPSQQRADEIKERTQVKIDKWTKDMVDTSALTKLMQKLQSGVTWVTVKGQPGEGKTTAAFMALQKLHQSGREVFHVLSPEEFNDVTTTCHHPVVMVDDLFGQVVFDPLAWSKWNPIIFDILEEREHTLNEKTSNEKIVTVIFVGRNYVLNDISSDTKKIHRYFTDDKYVVFMSQIGERTISEKTDILKAIANSKGFELDDETINIICNVKGPHGFPHTCRLFVTLRLEGVEIDTEMFMKSPLDFLNQTVIKFLQDSLILLLFKEMIKKDGKITLRELHSLDNKHAIIILVKSLLDSYLRKEDDCYYFHHPSIYDSVSFNLLEYEPLFVIKSCSLSFLHERVRLQTSCNTQPSVPHSELGLVANIDRCFIIDLAKRFAAEIENGNLRLVLSHKALTDQLFIKDLMCSITLPLTELLTLTDKQTKQSFLSLVASNKSPQLLKYIDKQTDIQLTEGDINTVLYGVCRYAASDVLTYLVQSRNPLDINVRYKYDKTPLMIASETRDSQFVQQLMSLGPDLKARDSLRGLTGLRYLCDYGLESVVEEMIYKGEDIKVGGRSCRYNQVETVRPLLNRGTKIDAKTVVETCGEGSVDLVESLFERGATVNMATDCYTPLTAASEGGHVKVMRFLIDEGASVNAVDGSGQSPLHRVCDYN